MWKVVLQEKNIEARFQVLTVIKFQLVDFGHDAVGEQMEAARSSDVGILPYHYTVSQPRKQRREEIPS
jgi:hypothetical protein